MSIMLKDLTIPTLLIEGSCDQAQEFATQALCGYFCSQSSSRGFSKGDGSIRLPKGQSLTTSGREDPARPECEPLASVSKGPSCTSPEGPLSCDCFCVDCRRIKQRQHPSLLWICPEKDYTIDEVDAIFEKVRFALENHEKYFFVLEKAQTFNAATANRLLKLLEEPPQGYVFILLTTNKNALLPTIISRSHIISLGAKSDQDSFGLHPIADYFMSGHKLDDPIGFELELKKNKLTDREAVQLCFDMLEHVAKRIGAAKTQAEIDQFTAIIDTIKEHLRTSPGSGSADFFLKRLFLYMPRG